MLKKGDRVYLLRKNMKTKRLSDKLDYKKVGPFTIKEKLGPVNYRLKLLNIMRIYLVFYIALLELAPPGTPLETTTLVEIDNNMEYEVERILNYQLIRRKKKYLIKWLGYPDTENS
jgi:hypothetical protein